MSRPVHFEVHATDPARAIVFYERTFGWAFKQWGDQEYWLISTGPTDEPGIDGGLLPRRGDGPQTGAPVNSFVVTVQVDDLDTTVKAATDAGGDVRLPRMALPGVGYLAYVADTEGNLIGVMEPDESATLP
jgi:predicted enzyme related to lactoylglutathione lyase